MITLKEPTEKRFSKTVWIGRGVAFEANTLPNGGSEAVEGRRSMKEETYLWFSFCCFMT